MIRPILWGISTILFTEYRILYKEILFPCFNYTLLKKKNPPLCQWTSVAFAQKIRTQYNAPLLSDFFQRQACLGCIQDRAKQVLTYDKNHAMTICIIAGVSVASTSQW